MVGFKGGKIPPWIRDDRTWCADYSCDEMDCCRNPKKIADKNGVYSFALFRESEECPIYQLEHRCYIEEDPV